MMKDEATTIVVLTAILANHNKAIKANPQNIAKINAETINAIRDNVHNIHPRETAPKESV